MLFGLSDRLVERLMVREQANREKKLETQTISHCWVDLMGEDKRLWWCEPRPAKERTAETIVLDGRRSDLLLLDFLLEWVFPLDLPSP